MMRFALLLALAAGCAHTSVPETATAAPAPSTALMTAAGALDIAALRLAGADQPLCVLTSSLAAGARAGAVALTTGELPPVLVDYTVCGPLPASSAGCWATYAATAAGEVAAEVAAPDGRLAWPGAECGVEAAQ